MLLGIFSWPVLMFFILGHFFLPFSVTCITISNFQVTFASNFPWPILPFPIFESLLTAIFHDLYCHFQFSGHFCLQFSVTCITISNFQVTFDCNFPWPVLSSSIFRSLLTAIFRDLYCHFQFLGHFCLQFSMTYIAISNF